MLPRLEELVLDLPIRVQDYYKLVSTLRAPRLRKLWIRTEDDNLSEDLVEYLTEKGDQVVAFAAFPLLTDLWIPSGVGSLYPSGLVSPWTYDSSVFVH
jgi:hypothetical protein